MSKEKLDMAKPISVDAATDYYKNNIRKILNSVSTSTINSIGIEKDQELYDYCSSSTASDSEAEGLQNIKEVAQNSKTNVIKNTPTFEKPEQTSRQTDLDLYNRLQKINSVQVTNSNDVHIGNKTFFHGPVTIKNIVLSHDDSNGNVESLGITNQGFEGSHNNLCTKHKDNSSRNEKLDENNKIPTKKFLFGREISWSKKTIVLVTGTISFLITSFIALFLTLHFFKDDISQTYDIEIIPRKEWNAKEATEILTDLELPVSRVIICHTVTSKCDTRDECVKTVEEIQNLHFGVGFEFSDIGYNFLIGGDGNIYEGRGWYKQGAHTSGYNRGSLGIAYIGNFMDKLPKEKQIAAGFKLFKEGVKLGHLTSNFIIYGASQLRTTESPGRTFMELIKTWPQTYKDS